MRSHHAAKPAPDFADDFERLGPRRAASPIRARDVVGLELHQPGDVFKQLLGSRRRLGRKQLERQAELAGTVRLRNRHASLPRLLVATRCARCWRSERPARAPPALLPSSFNIALWL